MSKRSSQPALYEMIRSRGAMPAVPSISPLRKDAPPRREPVVVEEIEVMRDRDAPSSPLLERLLGLLSPGRTVRMPVGYLLLAGGALLVLLMITYIIGVSAGKSIQRAEFNDKFGEGFDLSRRTTGVNDPLTLAPANVPSSDNLNANVLNGNGAALPNPASAGVAGRPSSEWGPAVPTADPRRKGWNYFILAEDSLEGMKRLAEFCRENGLESYVVAGNNDRRRLIAFPGYQGSRLAPEVRSLEDRIHAIGDKYKSQNKNQTNMRDAYPALFGG